MTDEASGGRATRAPGDAPETPVSDLGYAAASGELDEIIAELDAGMIDVDVLEVRFRRAIEIVEELDRRIRGARERVDALAPRLEAIGAEEARGDRR
jgi:exonuclease VII small subunit